MARYEVVTNRYGYRICDEPPPNVLEPKRPRDGYLRIRGRRRTAINRVATMIVAAFIATLLIALFAGLAAYAAPRQDHCQRFRAIVAATVAAAKDDSAAERLVASFQTNTFASRVIQGQPPHLCGKRHAGMDASRFAPFMFIPAVEARTLAAPLYYWKQGPAFLFNEEESWQAWFLGAVMLFHLHHWDAHVSGREALAISAEERRAADERAYTLEIAALNRLTKGALAATIARVRKDPNLVVRDTLVGLVAPNAKGILELQKAWPDNPAGDAEMASRFGISVIAFALAQRTTPQERAEALRWMMRHFSAKRSPPLP